MWLPYSWHQILIEIIFEDICNNQLTLANLPGVLYGFETLSAIFSVRMLGKRVLRTILQPKKDEVAEDWRRLLRPHYSPNIIRVIESKIIGWTEHVARVGIDEFRTGF